MHPSGSPSCLAVPSGPLSTSTLDCLTCISNYPASNGLISGKGPSICTLERRKSGIPYPVPADCASTAAWVHRGDPPFLLVMQGFVLLPDSPYDANSLVPSFMGYSHCNMTVVGVYHCTTVPDRAVQIWGAPFPWSILDPKVITNTCELPCCKPAHFFSGPCGPAIINAQQEICGDLAVTHPQLVCPWHRRVVVEPPRKIQSDNNYCNAQLLSLCLNFREKESVRYCCDKEQFK
jgi:hypothetical protein